MKRCALLLLTCLVLLAPAQNAAAAEGRWKDLNIVSTDEVKAMLDAGEDFVLINALSPIEFAEKRIGGSVNIPYGHLIQGEVSLPEDKGEKLVFYCKGPKCTKSKKSAAYAIEQGYTNVFVYDEGLPAWGKRGLPMESDATYPKADITLLSPGDLKAMIDGKEDLFLLDLRDSDDRKAGWIEDAVNIPMDSLLARFEEVPKGKKIVTICLHGKQSPIAARFLASKGYENLAKLDGGMVSGWIKSGQTVMR